MIPALLLVLASITWASADSADRFGLHHTSLGQATIRTNDNGRFSIESFTISGDDGAVTELGAAESGVFILPGADTVSDGYFLTARPYGSVSGAPDSLIGVVHGRRAEYATFYASADYSAIGATSVTFQVWSGNAMIAESTVTSGEARMYAENSQPPRVNPWWKQANGERGASIEFSYPLPIALSACTNDCSYIYGGNRIFIRPNGATSVVEHVSRIEVVGGGGLSGVYYDNMQLGMFARAHTALGPAKLVATNGMLKIDDLPLVSEDAPGVLAEFERAATAEIHLLPLDIAVPNTNQLQELIVASASGTRSNYTQFIGAGGLANSNGVLHLLNLFYDEPMVALTVYSNNVATGTSSFPANVSVTIGGTPHLTEVGANADTLASPAGVAFRFDASATFQVPGGDVFTGDRAVIGWPQATGVADILGISIQTYSIQSFTIINESSTSSIPRLSIQRSGNYATLSWPDPAGAFLLQRRENIDASFGTLSYSPSYQNGIATMTVPVMGEETADIAFFRLVRFAYPY